MSGPDTRHFVFGPYRLDPQQRLLFRGDEEIALTPRAFDTLLVLVEHHGRVLMKEDLMKAVWTDAVVEENNLTQSISRLRRVLNDTAAEAFIETVPRRGYRFIAPVEECHPGTDTLIRRRTTVRVVAEEESEEQEAQEEREPLHETEALTRAGPIHASAAHARTRRVRFVGIVIASLAGMAAMVAYVLLAGRLNPGPSKSAPRLEHLTGSGRAILAAISPDGQYLAYSTEAAGHQSLWLRQIATDTDVQIVPPDAVDYWGLTFSPDSVYLYYVVWQRNRRDATLQRVPALGGASKQLLADVGSPISFSPDGSRFAFTIDHASRVESRVMLAAADGTVTRTLCDAAADDMLGAVMTGPAWSPDGSSILIASGKRAASARQKRIIDVRVDDGRVRTLHEGPWMNVGPIVWLRDGSGFLMTASDAPWAPRQIWHISYPAGEARNISNDPFDYSGVSLTRENDAAAAVQINTLSELWVRTASGHERMVASEIGDRTGAEGFSWTPEGRIVYAARSGGDINLWSVLPDATDRRQLTVDAGNNFHPAVSIDGRSVVFTSDRSGTLALWKMEPDGSHPVRLTAGRDEVRPALAPNGRWIVYQEGHGWVNTTLARISIDGGDPTRLTTTMSLRPAVSPDGESIAFYSMDDDGWSLALISPNGGPPAKKYAIPATGSRVMRWTPDGSGLAYIDDRDDESTVRLQRLDGSPSEPLTTLHGGDVVAFDWSPDGRYLAYVRVTRSSDVVRLRFQD